LSSSTIADASVLARLLNSGDIVGAVIQRVNTKPPRTSPASSRPMTIFWPTLMVDRRVLTRPRGPARAAGIRGASA
jgi:hypothetical protein